MSDLPREASRITGLTILEAREFHRIFVWSFIGFVVVAIIAHVLAWIWRPWLPGPHGYSTSWLIDQMHGVLTHASIMLT
ncbi:MAG TPA: light-harvesting antenna LH1, beta subunit [Acetobacteraceae bacterium]|nr:light-harvesting antenna LH1, beta subunit [Acetobacteraceae bacterium]